MDEVENMIRASSIPGNEAMEALHLFSVMNPETRGELVALCRNQSELLSLFWENYKVKRQAFMRKDTALWTSILEAEREKIEEAGE